jgi:hypothetical protein
MEERIVVISDGSSAAADELVRAAERQAGTGALEVLHVMDEAEVPSDPAGRASRIGAERSRLDREVDGLARRFPLLRVASRVLVGNPAAVRRRVERLGTPVLSFRR